MWHLTYQALHVSRVVPSDPTVGYTSIYLFEIKTNTLLICKRWLPRIMLSEPSFLLSFDNRPHALAPSNKQRQPQYLSAVLISDHETHPGSCYPSISGGPKVLPSHGYHGRVHLTKQTNIFPMNPASDLGSKHSRRTFIFYFLSYIWYNRGEIRNSA